MVVRGHFALDFSEYLMAVYELVCVCLYWRRIGKFFSPLTRYAEQNKMRK
jgi:hypothetical protein